MKISNNGLNLIKRWEGCRLTAYQDSVGVWTIGYGTTNADKSITGTEIKSGLRISQQTADSWLEASVNKKYSPLVDKYNSIYHFNQNQFDALVSFCYNIGSIDQLTKRGTRSLSEIANSMTAYCNASGKKLQGLVNRRNDELKLFNMPCNLVVESTENKVNEGREEEMKVYQNGSTKEIVYSDTDCEIKLGSLSPKESCDCLGIFKNLAIVRYQVGNTGNYKIGFVKWLQGIK